MAKSEIGYFSARINGFFVKNFPIVINSKGSSKADLRRFMYVLTKRNGWPKKVGGFSTCTQKKYLIPDFIPWFFVLKCQPNSFHLLKDLTFFMYFVQHTEGFFSELLDQLWSGQVGWDFLQIGIYWIKDRNPGETGDIFHGCIK